MNKLLKVILKVYQYINTKPLEENPDFICYCNGGMPEIEVT